MKGKFLLMIILLWGSLYTIMAQDHTILLFEKFINGKIHFKNHSVTTASLNYDAGHGKMLFLQNGELMEITNSFMIDSISFGERQFIPFKDSYVEVIETEHGKIYVNWILKDVNIGSKGAYGMPTHGKVENLKNYDFGLSTTTYTAYDKQDANSFDMFRRKNANKYLIEWDGGLKEIKNVKQLIRLFPDKEAKIRQFISDKKSDMKVPYDAIELSKFCLTLKD